MTTCPRPKKHPSKDPRTIARDIAKAICAPVLDLADIECGGPGRNEEGDKAYWWCDDLINAARGPKGTRKEDQLYDELMAKVPADLHELLSEHKTALENDAICQKTAGFLLGLEIGAQQSTMILTRRL